MRLFKQTQNQETVSNQVKRILTEENLQFKIAFEEEQQIVISLGMALNSGNTDCFLDIQGDRKVIEMLTFSPVHVPENKRDEIARYLNIVAHHLSYGHFELDPENGRLRHKTYLLLPDEENLPDDLIKRSFYGNLHSMDRYFPGVMQIAYGNITAQRAIELIQNNTDPQLN